MPAPTPLPTTYSGPARWLLLALAGLCVALGVIGLFLPLLPTVPFLLLAAWAAARSSPRLEQWLYGHPRFGQALRDWREGGLVPRRAKWLATGMMAASGVILLVVLPQRWAALAAIGCMACVALWLWRRPEKVPAGLP